MHQNDNMKKLFLLFLFPASIFAQNVIYSNDFSGGSVGWAFTAGNNFDLWVVNSTYTCSSPTPDQGGGNYLHVADDLNGDYCAAAGFLGIGSGGTVYATMTAGINTSGTSLDTLRFDWLCSGQTGPVLASFGTVEYSINQGASWNSIPPAQYNGQSTWTTAVITSTQIPQMVNQPDFRLRFGFVNSGYGTNPAFAIDNISVTADVAVGNIENLNQTNLFVQPNPAGDRMTIMGKNLNPEQISIWNLSGQRIPHSQYALVNQNQNQLAFNIEHLSPGVYFVNVNSGVESLTLKLIKQ
jgi:hypothetical protein